MTPAQLCLRCPVARCRGECVCTDDGHPTARHVAQNYCPKGKYGTAGAGEGKWEPPKDVPAWKLDSKGDAGCGCA